MSQKITVGVAFNDSVTGEEYVDNVVGFSAPNEPGSDRGSYRGDGGVLIQEELDVIRREAAASGTSQESREVLRIPMRETKLALRRHVLVAGYTDYNRPELTPSVGSEPA